MAKLMTWSVVVMSIVLAAAARGDASVPDGATSMIGSLGDVRMTGVEPLSTGESLTVRVAEVGEHPWSSQVAWHIDSGVEVGDVLLLRVRCRTLQADTGEGAFGLNVEQYEGDWSKLASAGYLVPKEWTTFNLPFVADQAYGPGQWQVALHLGSIWQDIEFAEVSLLQMPAGTDIGTLPRTMTSYAGRAIDAPWRAEALERIEKLRVSDVRVIAVDEQGVPIAGATVTAEQTRSAFAFGSAITARHASGTEQPLSPYRAIATQFFNEIVFENAMKWEHHGLGDQRQIDAALVWALDNGMTARGHTLVWPGWRNLPASVKALEHDPFALSRAVESRVVSTVFRYRRRLAEWDVVNEAYANHDLMDILGYDHVAKWFRMADAAAPEARMYINDYGILTAGRVGSPQQDAYFNLITQLLADGTPVEGIGMQGHFGGLLTPPAVMVDIFDRFATLGLPIKITEYDLNSDDDALQADYLRDVLIAAYSHEAVEGVVIWGFWAGAHWRPDAAMFREDWTARPHADVWRELVLNEWKRVEPATTNAEGVATIRAHHGTYAVRVSRPDGRAAKIDVEVANDAGPIRVVVRDRPARR